MCLAQGPQHSDVGVRLKPAALRSQVKQSTTEQLRSLELMKLGLTGPKNLIWQSIISLLKTGVCLIHVIHQNNIWHFFLQKKYLYV